MKLRFIAPLLLLFVVQGCAHNNELTVAEKAAKLLIVGVEGQSLTPENSIIPSIADKGVAGVILFGSNVSSREQVTTLISDLKALRQEPLIVAIDQEGGLVNRLKVSSGFEPMASHRTAGSTTDDEALRTIASIIASEVASIGVNLNFAPCVDVDINPTCPVIGHFGRSFSPDEQRVAWCAAAYVEEHRKVGVRTALKHFPGHGSSLADSHFGLTDITATWQPRELTPYTTLMANDLCDAVMVSHLYNANIDPNYPATLSHATIQGLLRDQMGWQGVVVTDDMQMRAITDHYGFEQAVILGLNAGVDLFIVGGNIRREEYNIVDKFIKTIEDGIASGKITTETLDNAVQRVTTFTSTL